ncbi:MAG: hypothetical protein U0804_00570 [Gemmataceae bacterium]
MRLDELGRTLRETDPAAVLVDPPVLARVAQAEAGIGWAFWAVPHDHCWVVDRQSLFKHVERDELLLPPDYAVPDTVLLLAKPTAAELDGPPGDLLGKYWRLLFHAAAHRELNRTLAGITPAALRERVERVGPAAFEEARNVLVQDNLLAPKADDRAAYAEFAAVFLEMRLFNPAHVAVYFPSLPPAAAVEGVLAADVDGPRLFAATRPANAPTPAPKSDDQADESYDFYYRLRRQATRAAALGDTVAAAISHTRAARVAPGNLTASAQDAARNDLFALVRRMQLALGVTDDEAQGWKAVLPRLLDKADQGNRTVEAALLHDLQRACREHELPTYALDAVEYALSAGRTKLRRELKGQPYVRVPAHLRLAARRLAAARLTDADRQALGSLIQGAIARAETRLREQFRPILATALKDAGLQPSTVPEQAALAKTVEELLDRVSATGFLGFGDVRDAIARGQMKLPDLGGANEYVRGDPLLRLDSRLAAELDGVYRRAELYTRGLEQLTAIGFGTETGRRLTRNVFLPFGAAFLVAQFVWLMVFEYGPHPSGPEAEQAGNFLGGWNQQTWFHLSWLGLGGFFLLVIRSAAVRRVLHAAGRKLYRAARFVFWEVPYRLWASPWVQRLIDSVPVQFLWNFVAKPAALTGVLVAAFQPHLWDAGGAPQSLTFLASVLVVNTRPGRVAGELLLEAARRLIDVARSFPALLRWINDLFRDLVDFLEWVLARVEDWLRLRGNGGRVAVAVRAVAGVLWMPVEFLIRFYTVVLIEPMINPLKLPLSILFAKFVYPLLAILGLFTLSPLGSPLVEKLTPAVPFPVAWLLVVGTFYLLPDAFTFLFWEMRENWRLYRANRPTGLRPVSVGPGGETVKGLLHIGFHSGTVPRLYARLRAAEREAARTDVWQEVRQHRASLRDVEEAVRRFVARDFLAVLNNPQSGWTGPVLSVGEVNLGTNRIRLEVVPLEGTPAWLEWEDRSGWLVAGWANPGFLTGLPDDQAGALANALGYLFKRAGVDVVREEVRAALPKDAAHFDVGPAGLLVWYGAREGEPVIYDLGDPGAKLRPLTARRRAASGEFLEADRVAFGRRPLTWSQWTGVWPATPGAAPTERDLALLPPRPKPH